MIFLEPKESMVFIKDKQYIANIETDKGNITCELFYKNAPISVTNFIQLSKNGFYNGLCFHRVISNFVIQGGDPLNDGTGGPGYTLPSEIGLKHKKGSLCWARLSDQVNPQKRSSGSQFYITLEDIPYLDGEYTVFGQIIDGFNVINGIKKGDIIKKISINIDEK
jgi:cyclophilin family peptidyl-prolyl cis-trans isomerase